MHLRGIIFFALTGLASAFPDSPAPKQKGNEPHWAFQMPASRDLTGDAHAIDQYLVQSELILVGEASREILIRRAWHVITGLLPSQKEHDFWLKDSRSGEEWMRALSAAALSQKTYGERWARHWLDVARYADTKGAAITENENYPYA